MEFSIIIPCYNCEKTLPRALDSIAAQNNPDIEVILVDDGSTDHTFKVAQNYKHDSNLIIQLQRQSNQGPGAARNLGIEIAQGNYIIFLDADDYFEKNAFRNFKNTFQNNPNIDMIIAGHQSLHSHKIKTHKPKQLKKTPYDKLKAYLLGDFNINMGAVAIKRSSIRAIRFPSNVRNGEDIVFYSHCLCLLAGVCIDSMAVTIDHHEGSQRHQYTQILTSGEKIPDLIFSRKDLPPEVYALKKQYTAHKLISLAKLALKMNKKSEAKHLLLRAIQLDPLILLKTRTLKTIIKMAIPKSF